MEAPTPPYLQIMTISEIASRLHRMMRRNASDANYVPFAALARYLGLHRDTLYEAAKGVAVDHTTQMLLSRFLIRFDAGELEARQIPDARGGRYEIFEVDNPKPRLRLRVAIDLIGGGHRITNSPYQTPPRMPSFANVFNLGTT